VFDERKQMISGTHTVEIATPPERLWDFLANFDNWAEFVVGFQKFRIVDQARSVWTLRGDVGVLAREVDLEVVLLEQEPGRRATYSITGITERIEGTGTFEISPGDGRLPTGTVAETSGREAEGSAPRATPNWWRRLMRRWVLAVLRRQRAKAAKTRPEPTPSPVRTAAENGERNDHGPRAMLTFTLNVTPGGPMAPMIEMLMRPLLEPSAEDFSLRIREQLEGGAHA
jgi:carbon monoxide dehydrogenase subunit G